MGRGGYQTDVALPLAAAFVERWGSWDDALHGVIAQRMRDSEQFRYRLVRYSALGE